MNVKNYLCVDTVAADLTQQLSEELVNVLVSHCSKSAVSY